MPFYEYQCTECGRRLEILQKISDDPLVYCPECSQPTLKKLISAAAFHLKGTGWYETDFKNKDKKVKTEETAEPKKAGDSGSGESVDKSKEKAKTKDKSKSDSSGSSSNNSATSAAA